MLNQKTNFVNFFVLLEKLSDFKMLQRVHIENFKSLKNVSLELQRINLLIGPNNSGKTNLLRAFDMFLNKRFHANSDVDKFVNLSYNRQADSMIAQFSWQDITKKTGNVYHRTNVYSASVVNDNTEYDVNTWITPSWKILDAREGDPEHNLEDLENYKFCYSIERNLGVFQPDSTKMVGYQTIGSSTSRIDFDASNVVNFLESLHDEHRDEFYQLEKDLQVCLPEFSYISFRKIADNDSVKKEIGLYNNSTKQTFWSEELSEGVLYFLALLCVIHQPNPPKLLLLEEPERGIHPRRIKEVVGFIKQLAYEKDIQVVMSSHSPLVLDEFTETPESVFVFDKDDEGATLIRNLQRDVIEPENKKRAENGMEAANYTDALGENWTIGFLGGVPR